MMGSIQASCGCKLADDEYVVDVMFGDETCDAVDGFRRCVVYASYCPACAARADAEGWLFHTEQQADEWFAGDPKRKSVA